MLAQHECTLLEQLWHQQATVMRAYVLARTGNVAEADDTVGEVYWRACRALAGGSRPHQNPKGWIWQILHHYRIDRARRQARLPVVATWPPVGNGDSEPPIDTLPGRADPPDAVALDTRRRVRKALAQLPPRQAMLIFLRHYEGYTLEEIAGGLGISYGAAKAIHHRAVVGLRSALGAYR